MFTSFNEGAEESNDNDRAWEDTPNWAPGRFHALARPGPTTGGAISPSGRSPSPPGFNPRAIRLPFTRGQAPPSTSTGRGLPAANNPFSPANSRPPSIRPPARKGVSRRLLEPVRDVEGEGQDEESWLLLRPGRKTVERWLESWWRRWAVLVLVPCLIVWIWCAVPFPLSDPYDERPPWNLPWPGEPPVRKVAFATDPSPLDALSPVTFSIPASPAPHSNLHTLLLQQPPRLSQPVHADGARLARREMQTSYGGLGGAGLWVAERAADLVGFPRAASGELVESRSDGSAIQATADGQGKVGSVAIGRTAPARTTRGEQDEEDDTPMDANFLFYLFWYYGVYLAVALLFVTKLFDLYRLNWWPSSLGGSMSYFLFWSGSLAIAFSLHYFDLDGLGRRSRGTGHAPGEGSPGSWDWERKSSYVGLAFLTMSLPAWACFAKLRADRRQRYRRDLTATQKAFLESHLFTRMPRSYKRFLYFVLALVISLCALLIGQAFATVYLSTLPHSATDGVLYAWTWQVSVMGLNAVSQWVLQRKVRSRALVFVFRLWSWLLFHVFYRNLFARLRSPDQVAWIQLLSSTWVVLWYPLTASRTWHRFTVIALGNDKEWDEHAENVCIVLYTRNLSENVTMVGFLGWLTLLHYGPNQELYPFFKFSEEDVYNYRLTAIASLTIWGSELVSSYVARAAFWFLYELDVTNIGLDELRDHPELCVAAVYCSIHVLQDLLFFLVKLNFR